MNESKYRYANIMVEAKNGTVVVVTDVLGFLWVVDNRKLALWT